MSTPLTECIAPSFYDLHKTVRSESATEYWLRGGRGSCKSSFVSIELILSLMRDPEANAVAFRRYENEIRDSVFAQLQWAINKLGVDHLWKSYVSPFKLLYEPTGQVILFKGADNPKKLKSVKLSKGYMKIGWWEELDQFAGMEEIRNIQQSIFRGSTSKQIAFYSYNPPKSARSWANAETKVEKPGRIVHYSDYRTVPPHWLGQTFIGNAEHLKSTNEDAYNHEYLGRETGTGLEVFSNVTLRKISPKEITYFDQRYQGLDFGYAADPLCFLQGHFDSKHKKLYLFFEISGTNIKNAKFASMLSEEQRTDVTMADSSEPKSIDELRDEHNVNVMAVDKAPGSVEHGIKYMQDLEEIIIDPARCPLAAFEFINYALDVNRDGETISRYPDKMNHCFAGETLVTTPTGYTRIDQIEPGGTVMTRQGPRKVNKVFTNRLETVTTKLLNGQSLTLTDTHNIITSAGDVMFRHLKPSDTVYYEDGVWGVIETENRKLSYIVAKSIVGIQKAKDEMIECITNSPSQGALTNTFTSLSMKMKRERFLKTTTSTIKMGTHLTILSIIWPVWKAQNIYRYMLKNIIEAIKMLSGIILTGFAPLQSSGTVLMRGLNGTDNTVVKYSQTEAWSKDSATNVGKPMKWMSSLQKETHGSVLTTASQRGEGLLALMMRTGLVRSVGRLLGSTNTVNDGVVTTVRDVFDLEVDEAHEYFANGLLVHNSVDAVRYLLSQQIKEAKIERKRNKFKTRRIPVLNRW